MKRFLRKFLPVILMILVTTGIINHTFKKVLACPECYLFEDTGDGLKNYFTFTWFVLEDRGTHFSGMNAPYGEHIFFTDNHPGLAMVMNFIHRHITDLDGHTIGIINVLLILSLLIAVLFMYAIFRKLSVGRYTAAAFAIAITFLSPQIARFGGHFSLAHVSLVPIFLWLLINYHFAERKWRWAIGVIGWITLTGYIHLYFFLMMSVFVGFYLLIDIFERKYWRGILRKRRQPMQRALQITAMLLIPAVLLLLFLQATDPVTDRPTSPWRSIGLNAKFHSTFIPNYGPFPDYWKAQFKTLPPEPEAMAYVSLAGFFLIPAALAFLARGIIRKKKPGSSGAMHTFLLASVGVWALAAGILYAPPFDIVLDIMPKLKQFRGLGRLAWMFYYVYTIFIGYYLYRLARFLSIRAKYPAGYYLLIASLLVMGFEAYLVQRPVLTSIFKPNQYLDKNSDIFTQLLDAKGMAASDFQAILQLPLVSLGGETSGLVRGLWTMRKGIQASFESRLPLIDWSLSRTSVAQSADFVQLISSTAVEKERVHHMTDKPVLLVCEEEFITAAEKALIEKAEFIGRNESITLYRLPVSAFYQDLAWWQVRLDTLSDALPPLTAMNFEDDMHTAPLLGSGIKKVRDIQEPIYTYVSEQDTITPAVVHLWVYINEYDAGMSVLRIRETAPDGQVIYDQGKHRRDVPWSEVVGQWMRLDRQVTIREKGYRYDFFIDAQGTEIDALQIRALHGHTIVDYPEQEVAFLDGVLVRK